MAITSGEINFYETANAGLGGVVSSNEIANATPENLFDNVGSNEATAGIVEYRCFYVQNDTVSGDTLTSAEIFIAQNTPSPTTDIEIGLDPAGLNGNAVIIASEDEAPAGVTFSVPDANSPLSLGALAPTDNYPIWVKRTVNPGTAAVNNDNVQITVRGDSPAA